MHIQPVTYHAVFPPGKDGEDPDGSERTDLHIAFVDSGRGPSWKAQLDVVVRGSETAVGAKNLMVMRLRHLANEIERSEVG